jgi:hypothetical protein
VSGPVRLANPLFSSARDTLGPLDPIHGLLFVYIYVRG